MKITDSITLLDTNLSDDGYLVANARTARTGIQQYLGSELGRPDLGVVNVYRDESQVFARKSLDTFSRLPITNDHPAKPVNASNWRDLAVGTTGDEVLRDGEYLKIGLKITDGAAVAAVQAGKRELSVGYGADIVWVDGVAPDGTPYQARQENIVANHVAIVSRGRAGARASIGDSWDFQPGSPPNTVEKGPMTDSLKTVVLGDKAVQVAVSDVAAIEQFKTDSAKALSDAKDAIAAKDVQIGTLTADLATAQAAANIDVDALVADRIALETQVHAIDASIDTKGKSAADLRRAAVVVKLGDAMVEDASEDQIIGMFKALARDTAPTNPVRGLIATGLKVQTNDADAAQQSYADRLSRRGK